MKALFFTIILGFMTLSVYAQIIADHTVVDRFDDIPQQYLDVIKTMLVAMSGESHSSAYRYGTELLEQMDGTFQVETFSGSPIPSSTDQNLRIGRHRVVGEDYFFSQSKMASLKNEITSQNSSGNPFHVMGFGWCWDMTDDNGPGGTEDPVYHVRWAGRSEGGPDGNMRWGLDSDDQALTGNSVSMDTYLEAVESYILHCQGTAYPTTWVFTTGPVDYHGGTENGFQREIKQDYIRAYVRENTSRILFDYADILCWNNSGEKHLEDWNDEGSIRSHAQIHPDNMFDYDASWNLIAHSEDGDHIGEVGAVRLAKAMWWMLARIAGWEDQTSGIESNEKDEPSQIDLSIYKGTDYLNIETSASFINGMLQLIDMNGRSIISQDIEGNITRVHTSTLSSGAYIVLVSKGNIRESRKLMIVK